MDGELLHPVLCFLCMFWSGIPIACSPVIDCDAIERVAVGLRNAVVADLSLCTFDYSSDVGLPMSLPSWLAVDVLNLGDPSPSLLTLP